GSRRRAAAAKEREAVGGGHWWEGDEPEAGYGMTSGSESEWYCGIAAIAARDQ
ncbi:hypothetical protein E4U43_006582, partial [Claviceps pusilla]